MRDDELDMADEAPARVQKHFYLQTPVGPLTGAAGSGESLRGSPELV
jgi:hypothetical protein